MKLFVFGKGLIGSNFIKGKPEDIELTDIVEEADLIFHAAGYAQPIKFLNDEIATIEVNTTKLIDLFKKAKKTVKFLYSSSSEIYNGTPPPQNETQIGTTNPSHHRACYIEGKRCGEAICMAYKRLGYDVKIARISLTYGATKKGDTRALNYFIEQAIINKEIRLMDKGEARRTYLYVEDATKILWDILLRGEQTVYNVGGISKTTIAELAKKIGELTGANVILGDKGLDGAPDDVELGISRIINEFGKREFISLDEGLKKTIEWQQKNLG